MFTATGHGEGSAYTKTTPPQLVTSTATATATSTISQKKAQTLANNLATQIAQSVAQNDANIIEQTIKVIDTTAPNYSSNNIDYVINYTDKPVFCSYIVSPNIANLDDTLSITSIIERNVYSKSSPTSSPIGRTIYTLNLISSNNNTTLRGNSNEIIQFSVPNPPNFGITYIIYKTSQISMQLNEPLTYSNFSNELVHSVTILGEVINSAQVNTGGLGFASQYTYQNVGINTFSTDPNNFSLVFDNASIANENIQIGF